MLAMPAWQRRMPSDDAAEQHEVVWRDVLGALREATREGDFLAGGLTLADLWMAAALDHIERKREIARRIPGLVLEATWLMDALADVAAWRARVRAAVGA